MIAFKVVDFVQGSHVEFAANDRYFLGRPKVDRIIWRIITDSNNHSLRYSERKDDLKAWNEHRHDWSKVVTNPLNPLYEAVIEATDE